MGHPNLFTSVRSLGLPSNYPPTDSHAATVDDRTGPALALESRAGSIFYSFHAPSSLGSDSTHISWRAGEQGRKGLVSLPSGHHRAMFLFLGYMVRDSIRGHASRGPFLLFFKLNGWQYPRKEVEVGGGGEEEYYQRSIIIK